MGTGETTIKGVKGWDRDAVELDWHGPTAEGSLPIFTVRTYTSFHRTQAGDNSPKRSLRYL
jgi:hypothetical protein